MESVYESYVEGREWYFAVQWASAAVCGVVLGALQVIGNDDASLACPTAYAGCGVAIAFGAADMTLLHVLRPTAVRLEMWSGAIICALNIVSQALAASNAIDASNTLVTVCALLQLVVMLLLMLNGVAFVAQGEGEEPLRAAEGEHMGARCKAQKLEFIHNDTTKTHRSAKSTLIVVKAHDGKSVEGVPIVDDSPNMDWVLATCPPCIRATVSMLIARWSAKDVLRRNRWRRDVGAGRTVELRVAHISLRRIWDYLHWYASQRYH